MRFLHPNFLWALFFIIVPIIIHLFYFRRYKKIYFSNTLFLNELVDEQSTKNKLKHLLVLLSRIFAILFLVLAFAQPYIPLHQNSKQTTKLISIYLDNSFSMGTEGQGYLLFEEAKQTTQDILSAYNETHKFQVINNDFEAKHQRIVSKSEAIEMLEEMKISPARQDYSTVLDKQLNNTRTFDGEKIYYQLSDFQINNSLFKRDTIHQINLVKFTPKNLRNVSVENVTFSQPIHLKGQSNTLTVTFKNQSSEEKSGSFQLSINGVQKSLGNYTVAAHSETTDTLRFRILDNGWHKGKISINDYPLTFDDDYYFSFYAEEKMNVLSIYEGLNNTYINAVFQDNSQVNYTNLNVNTIDYNKIEDSHLIVLNNLKYIPTGLLKSIIDYVKSGGQLLLIPNEKTDISNYNQFLNTLSVGTLNPLHRVQRKVAQLNDEHPLFHDLFMEKPNKIQLPNVSLFFPQKKHMNTTKILGLSDNFPFISSNSAEQGTVYFISSPLGNKYNDFTSSALFAPLLYKMGIGGVKSSEISFPIQANTSIALQRIPKNAEQILRLQSNNQEIIPQKSIYNGRLNLSVSGNDLESGFYNVTSVDESYTALVALNYDRAESLLDFYTMEDLETHFVNQKNVYIFNHNIAQINDNIKRLESGKAYWKWCLLIALLFLAIEILLLRFLPN